MHAKLNGEKIFVGPIARFNEIKGELLEEHGVPEADLEITLSPAETRDLLRLRIEQDVGDEKSLLGTQADVMGLLVAGQMARVVALADHASNEAQRQELAALQELAGDADLVQLCRDGLAAIKAGNVVLTASIKGVDNVFAEAFTRSTATAAILVAATGG